MSSSVVGAPLSREATRSAWVFSACSKIVRAKRALPKPSPRRADSKMLTSARSVPSPRRYWWSIANFAVMASSSSVV
jgi:hypothetical protein